MRRGVAIAALVCALPGCAGAAWALPAPGVEESTVTSWSG